MRALLILVAALALPSPAAAAKLNELPFQALEDRQTAGCLRPTGEGLALYAKPGSVEVRQTGERVRLGRLGQCAAAAEAGGAGVVAGQVRARGRYEVRAAARDPGAGFGPAARVSAGPNPQEVVAAVAPTGRAAVAWAEYRGAPTAMGQRVRVVVARREPGQAFAAPEPVTGWWRGELGDARPDVGVDAAGRTTVAWLQTSGRFRARLTVAVAGPGSAFARRRLVGYSTIGGERVSLAVAPDGWALLAVGLDGEPAVYERAPSAAFRRVDMPEGDSLGSAEPAVAIGDGGGAVVAWRTGPVEGDGGVAAATRAPGGVFTRPETVSPSPRGQFGHAYAVLVSAGQPPYDTDADRLRAALGPGGRVLLAWTASRRMGAMTRVRAASGVLGGAFDGPQTVSSPMRAAEAPAPLFLADGRAAVAWLDNADDGRDGRLHLAVERASAPASRAPRLHVRAARVQRIFRSERVRVTARCDRACDIEAGVRGRDRTAVTLPAAGSRTMHLQRSLFARPREGTVRVDVRATEPGGRAVVRRTVRVRIVHRPALPLREPLGVRAHRRGDAIVVRWRTAGPARRMSYSVIGSRSRSPRGILIDAYRTLNGRGRTRFAARLRPDRPRRVRWVIVHWASFDRDRTGSVAVPVVAP